MGVEKYLIAPTLNLAVAQRLLRRLCSSCKKKVKANAAEEHIIKQALEKMPPAVQKEFPKSNFEIYKSGPGCKECHGKAFKGRIGIFETLAMTDELENIILTNLSEGELRKEAKRQGMLTMFQDGIIKVLHGVTSLEELLTVAQENEEGQPPPEE
jgi:type II secretory ATPase GspE/PulE/Tfp pilus assembly ATPase PilB-like protein